MIKYGVNVNGQIKDIKVLAVKFINDKYEVMPELNEIQEPSMEEQERAIMLFTLRLWTFLKEFAKIEI